MNLINYYYKRYGKNLFVLFISLIVLFCSMYLDEYLKENIIENKFIKNLNQKNYSEALKYICKSKNKNIFYENEELINFFDGDLNNFYGINFKIYNKLIVKDNFLKSIGYKDKIFFKYKNISKETIKDYFYIKIENGKKCLAKK